MSMMPWLQGVTTTKSLQKMFNQATFVEVAVAIVEQEPEHQENSARELRIRGTAAGRMHLESESPNSSVFAAVKTCR